MSLLLTAEIFARESHKGQVRKYTNERYDVHLEEVASFAPQLAKVHPEVSEEIIGAVSWLHDCVEDQKVTWKTLYQLFNQYGAESRDQVLTGVYFLSDTEPGNREVRKCMSTIRLCNGPGWVQSIKCVDTMSNSKSIYEHDKNFGYVFKKEKLLLLPLLTKANKGIRTRAITAINKLI